MKNIAFLLSRNMMPGALGARIDVHEFSLMRDVFTPAFATAGMQLEPVIWEDMGDASRFDAVIIGPTWDYWAKQAAFFEALTAISLSATLFNSLDLVTWNIDKRYLRDLAGKGVRTLPTVYADRDDGDTLADAMETLGARDLIVKPVVSANAEGLRRVRNGVSAQPTLNAPCLIQPFNPRIVEGERSLLFYGGTFSHAVNKVPARGDIRVQGGYGGVDHPYQPTKAEIELGEAALAACPTAPLYGRADMVLDQEDQPCLMELELIEPYHYVAHAPEAGERFARAVALALDEPPVFDRGTHVRGAGVLSV
jgi:glutathione synthase/RimK-type ligase-like ATP-grasp enzyme